MTIQCPSLRPLSSCLCTLKERWAKGPTLLLYLKNSKDFHFVFKHISLPRRLIRALPLITCKPSTIELKNVSCCGRPAPGEPNF